MATQITEEERRWALIGLCLIKVLTPALRKALAIEIPNWYNDLCQHPTVIDRQVYPGHQISLAPSTLRLNYKNINNNDASGLKPPAYDYAVKDPLSLAKLFVQPYMCKFTGFDETMDTSAALSLISEAKPFINMGAAAHAKDVKDIRNKWGHKDYPDEERFDECFEIMESLLKSINLSSKDEGKFCNELRSWKDYGPLNMEIIYLLRKEVLGLSKALNPDDNQARLIRLISVQGKDTLKMYFDSLHPPATLTTTLNDHRETLESLCKSRVITRAQMKLLFPRIGISSSIDYDVSLLFILLRNICGINPPASTASWEENPPTDDTTLEADLVRIGFYREMFFNRRCTGLSDDAFNTYCDAISGALIGIHRHFGKPLPTREIEELRKSPVGEDSYKIYKKLGNTEGIKERLIKKVFRSQLLGKWFLISALVILLSAFTFSAFLNHATEKISLRKFSITDFVGREWIFRELENLTSSQESRGVLIVAEPGWGKSTIMRQLINSPSSSDIIHHNIIGYYFCKFDDKRTRDGGRFVKVLRRFIAEKISKFREVLVKDDDCKNLPVECFQKAIIKPLKELDGTGRRNSYILIDALDECLEMHDVHYSKIRKILYETIPDFPSWVKLIVTSRNHPQSIRKISNIKGFSTLKILANDTRNEQDLRSYVEQKLRKLSPIIKRPIKKGWTDKEFIDLALQSSKGDFLILKKIVGYWQSNSHKIDQQSISAILGDIFSALFIKRFEKDRLKNFQPLLEVLLASNVPLTLSEIENILYLYDKRYATREVVSELSEFFKSDVHQAPLEFYHKSFAEWLTKQTDGNEEIFIQKSRGHQYIVDFLFHLYNEGQTNLNLEKLTELCTHILNAGKMASVENVKNLRSLNVSKLRDDKGKCILHVLASNKNATKVIAALIEQFNNSVDIFDNDGLTPAMYAQKAGAYENLKIFINNGANVSHTSPPSGDTDRSQNK